MEERMTICNETRGATIVRRTASASETMSAIPFRGRIAMSARPTIHQPGIRDDGVCR